ncbi:short-chain dehydrogenase [Nocardioides sp. Root1257]|uniref:SDR family NAD(P)-dependent oxidoreductase n=1 Tax=unclassified Nocardioides TaxID=2615069 RepID=UPI0006F21582|nr:MULTISPECIES: SDR family oxidoreductase [unclassified Nocardioides]KQW45006.1 short-chain dehydrogenase [Nocardioides sp. Root1257]KRC45990.1 short-chain dehydrogenase [Nocardioides sp. Root224]
MRSALITGASRGIGRGIALQLAQQGFGLTVTSRDESDLGSLAVHLREAGAQQVVMHAAELNARDQLDAVVRTHADTFGTMHALVLAAGVGTAGPVGDLPDHRVDKTFAVNVAATLKLVQASLPLLRLGAVDDPIHGARIIALASITGVYAEGGLAAYGASKAAVLSLMETINAEESKNGVMATAIAPGYVDTDMSAWVADKIAPASMIQVSDVVTVVTMLLELGATTSMTRLVMTRSGSDGYRA